MSFTAVPPRRDDGTSTGAFDRAVAEAARTARTWAAHSGWLHTTSNSTASSLTFRLDWASTACSGWFWGDQWSPSPHAAAAAESARRVRVKPKRWGAWFREFRRWVRRDRPRDWFDVRDRAARAKARALLLRHLDPAQRAMFLRDRYFYVRSQHGRLYRLRWGRAANVDYVGEDHRVLGTLCAHLPSSMPVADSLLAQVLMLEHWEDHFLETANLHWGKKPKSTATEAFEAGLREAVGAVARAA